METEKLNELRSSLEGLKRMFEARKELDRVLIRNEVLSAVSATISIIALIISIICFKNG